jgi:hypothetical protein
VSPLSVQQSWWRANFFDRFGLDPILWVNAHKPAESTGAYLYPTHVPGHLEPQRTVSETWRVVPESIPHASCITHAAA